MDPFGFLFIALMVILGGVVAYLGDLLGRRLGKRRLTLGRLRPKHTAALGTFLAGMVATLVTILVLALLSEPVRVMLLQGRQTRQQLAALEQRLATAQGDLKRQNDQITSVEGQLKSTSDQLNAEKKKLSDESNKVKKAQLESSRLLAQASRLRQEVVSIRTKLTSVNQNLQQLKTEYARLQTDTAAVRLNNDQYRKQFDQLAKDNVRLTNANAMIERQIQEATKRANELETSVKDLEEALRIANATFDERQRQNRAELQQAQKELDDAQQNLSQARAELSTLNMIRAGLERSFVDSRRNPLIYNLGDELSRLSVGSRLTQAEARAAVASLLGDASDDAESRGAINPPNMAASAGLQTITIGEERLTPEDQVARAIQRLAGQPNDQVIIARTFLNAFKAEFVPLILEIRPNPIVYRQGQLVIDVLIDGRETEQQVADRIAAFISTELRSKAIKDGMLPRVGRENELGEIPRQQLIAMVRGIKDVDRIARLQFFAERQTRAADYLVLSFRLR